MDINYVAAARNIMQDNVTLPVPIYDIAERENIYVLTAKIAEDKESELQTVKAVFLVSEFLKKICNELKTDVPSESQNKTFSLLLYNANALERRLIVAYYVALQYLYFKKVISAKEVTGNAILREVNTDCASYRLAMNILIPESSLTDILRTKGISRQDAKMSSSILEQLSKTFLVSKVDVEKRLEMQSSSTEVC